MLRRAWRLVGPIRRATRPVLAVMDEPFRGELEVEATLENLAGKRFPERDDWIVERREDREQQLVLMMDASLSMAGENLAVAAVAAAVLALKMRSEDLSVVVFESVARAVSRLEERDDPEQIVARLLSEPARGYTNIEAALRLGGREIGRGRNPRKAGLLITDGVVTAGGDPAAGGRRLPAPARAAHRGLQDGPGAVRAPGEHRQGRGVPRQTPQRAAGQDARHRQPRAALGAATAGGVALRRRLATSGSRPPGPAIHPARLVVHL